MKSLSVILSVAFMIFTASCISLPKSKNIKFKKTSPNNILIEIPSAKSIEPVEISRLDYWRGQIKYFIIKFCSELLALTALVLTWLGNRGYLSNRKRINLDEEDIATLGLASDALNDFMYRIRLRNKSQIIPFPKGD